MISILCIALVFLFFFFQAEDGIRDRNVTGVQTCALPIYRLKDLYTRTINNSGTAVFKGLSTGVWTVTMSGGGQSTTRTVEITADRKSVV